MNQHELHYLSCFDENCEEAACVDRRSAQQTILKLRTELADLKRELIRAGLATEVYAAAPQKATGRSRP